MNNLISFTLKNKKPIMHPYELLPVVTKKLSLVSHTEVVITINVTADSFIMKNILIPYYA